jgi:hypothetical protein
VDATSKLIAFIAVAVIIIGGAMHHQTSKAMEAELKRAGEDRRQMTEMIGSFKDQIEKSRNTPLTVSVASLPEMPAPVCTVTLQTEELKKKRGKR